MSKNSLGASDLFLGVLAILLISVSFYQTWVGLEQIFGNASFCDRTRAFFAFIISLLDASCGKT